MNGPKGNGILNVPRGNTEGNKSHMQLPAGSVIKCFVIPSNSKVERNCKDIVCRTPAGSQICRHFKGHDLITCKMKVPVAISRPRELVRFDPRHVFELEVSNKDICQTSSEILELQCL